MAVTINDGPSYQTGDLTGITAAMGSPGGPVPDNNQDASPNVMFQADGFFDVRVWVPKDQLQGYTGNAQAHLMLPFVKSMGQIPAALANNNIAAAQHVVSGTAMTVASASLGVTLNVPIRPFSGVLNGQSPTTAAIVLDFGFAFGNCTSGDGTVEVADSNDFWAGMNLVIGAVGNSGGTVPLLTQVLSIVDATHIELVPQAIPLATNATAPIGMGDRWGPSPVVPTPLPLAHSPFMPAGPSVFLDSRQAIARGVRIVGTGGSSGGDFRVDGWDIYWQPMSETITVAAGASTGNSERAFKAIKQVVPLFTDAQNYTVGTTDIYGFAYRALNVENTKIWWAGALVVDSTGFVAGVKGTATATSGDVRGTYVTLSASNGTVSSLAMSGRRLDMGQFLGVAQVLQSRRATPEPTFGSTQYAV